MTAPIVKHGLEPAFERLGPDATPDQVLDLKVCDPAMGSGAFLVEACRAIGERLVTAWERWPETRPTIPADEDEELHARRLVAQRCLCGVDKNPAAVDLARLSLWLATLAKDHEFTFLDHALKCGDSLVGLTREQIAAANWDQSKPGLPLFRRLKDTVAEAMTARAEIRAAPDDTLRAVQEERHRIIEDRLTHYLVGRQKVRQLITLVSNSAVQFWDADLDLNKVPNRRRTFWEEPISNIRDEMGRVPAVLQELVEDEATRETVDPATGRALPEDEIYNIGRNQAVEMFLGKWVPVPYFLVLARGDRNDLDLHVLCPDGRELFFQARDACGGRLDVDANKDTEGATNTPVENAVWDNPAPGRYRIVVEPYAMRDRPTSRFRVAIHQEGKTDRTVEGTATADRHGETAVEVEVPQS